MIGNDFKEVWGRGRIRNGESESVNQVEELTPRDAGIPDKFAQDSSSQRVGVGDDQRVTFGVVKQYVTPLATAPVNGIADLPHCGDEICR